MIEISLRGYCRTLSDRTAWRPAIRMTRFTTIASTGRLINKSVNFMHSPYSGRTADLDRQPGFLPLTFFRIRVRAVRWLYDIVDLDRRSVAEPEGPGADDFVPRIQSGGDCD